MSSSVPGATLRQRYTTVFRAMVMMAVLSYGSYLVLFLFFGVPLMPVVNTVATALCLVTFWPLSKGHLRLALFIMAIVVLGQLVCATLIFGWSANFHLFAFLFLVFSLLSPELKLPGKAAIFLAVTGGYLALELLGQPWAFAIAPRVVTIFKLMNAIVFAGTVGYLALIYSRAIWTATESLQTLNEQLTELATTDSLTRLLNRRSMNELIQAELARFERTSRPFTVILGDVDDFKSINDRHGHNVGDAALLATAEALRNSVRPMDRVGRWGGEEFLVILPEADTRAAELVAERVRERVKAAQVTSGTGQLQIKMTFGVATSVATQTQDQLLAAADAALYEGKRSGKDKVVIAKQ